MLKTHKMTQKVESKWKKETKSGESFLLLLVRFTCTYALAFIVIKGGVNFNNCKYISQLWWELFSIFWTLKTFTNKIVIFFLISIKWLKLNKV